MRGNAGPSAKLQQSIVPPSGHSTRKQPAGEHDRTREFSVSYRREWSSWLMPRQTPFSPVHRPCRCGAWRQSNSRPPYPHKKFQVWGMVIEQLHALHSLLHGAPVLLAPFDVFARKVKLPLPVHHLPAPATSHPREPRRCAKGSLRTAPPRRG